MYITIPLLFNETNTMASIIYLFSDSLNHCHRRSSPCHRRSRYVLLFVCFLYIVTKPLFNVCNTPLVGNLLSLTCSIAYLMNLKFNKSETLTGVPYWLAEAAPPALNAPQRCLQTRPLLHMLTQRWTGINASLTSLQWCGNEAESTLKAARGFRRFVVMSANNLGITGYIHRYTRSDVKVCYEGTEEQMAMFQELMSLWKSQGMIGDITAVLAYGGASAEGYTYRQNQGFSIHRNHSRSALLTSGRHGVITGPYSDHMEDFENISEYSADSTPSVCVQPLCMHKT
jgi:acylphosphatase